MKTSKHTFNKVSKKENLFIKVNSAFSGMTDCCEPLNGGFEMVEKIFPL